ncbi:MAG: hypothetical protein A2174_00575 [Candidatus Portnoybacteria bacterium RBG_13_41_18]|uniref:Serine protease n=1 Tax=Candidatus Portnoybacteria bacterium RBG_13_41_18 TaxID=1801991 RepID=A0A1G2FAH8_9BACT|nr:MAG: hypothetical protein A2174_00575 [Candidatus Portnoybacteria bacterium RBG_13_41_18]
MKNKVLNSLVIILLGGFAGVFFVQIFLPWLAGFSFFNQIDWIRRVQEGTTIINTTERVIIDQNSALEQAIDKAGKIMVELISQRTEKLVGKTKVPLAEPEILAQGPAIIVSSDGLILAAENLAPETAQKFSVVLNNNRQVAEVKKRDKKSGLVLLKINESNLPVLPFFEGELKLGQILFLISIKSGNKLVDSGIVKQIQPNLVIGFTEAANSSPIFNLKNEIVGLNLVDNNNQPKIVLSAVLRELLK